MTQEHRTLTTKSKKYNRIAARFANGSIKPITGDFKKVLNAYYVKTQPGMVKLIGYTIETVRGIEDFYTTYSDCIASRNEDADIIVRFDHNPEPEEYDQAGNLI